MQKKLLAGYGSAFVDIVINVSAEELEQAAPGVPCGTVRPVSKLEQQELLEHFAPERRQRSVGGSCANTLRHFALEAQDDAPSSTVRLIAPIGTDDNGEFFAEQVAKIPNFQFCPIVIDGAATNCCVALVTPDGERTMFPLLEAEQRVRAEQLTAEMLRGAQWLHIEGYTLRYPEIWERLMLLAAKSHIAYSVDAADCSIATAHRTELLDTRSKYFRWLFANEAEAKALCGNDYIRDWPDKRAVVITLGARGAFAVSKNFKCGAPALKVEKVVDTVGAGDSFIAGFLHSWIRRSPVMEEDLSVVKGLAMGCACAAKCIQHAGA
jgi:sugar/nucleoside kinase (ribokinase family)